MKKRNALTMLMASVITISNVPVSVSASELTDDALFDRYADAFIVQERVLPSDSARLSNEMYQRRSVYVDGVLYSAYKSGNAQEYDWTEYVELVIDRSAEAPVLRRNYHKCEQENGFYYSIHDSVATVHGADAAMFADAETLVIPETLGGYPVAEIAPHAFDGFSGAVFPKLQTITIPDTVEVICSHAFNAVFSQEKNASQTDRVRNSKINMPASVRYIGHFAFGFGTVCAFGDTLVLPETLEYVDQQAFYDNSVQILLFDDTQNTFGNPDIVSGKAPYLLTEEGYVPMSLGDYPQIILPKTKYVCNAYKLVVQAGFVTECKAAISQKEYAAYYVRNDLTYPAGDFNNDGRVNVADVVLMQRYLLCADNDLPAKWQTGDMNGDGKISSIDMTLLKRLLADR